MKKKNVFFRGTANSNLIWSLAFPPLPLKNSSYPNVNPSKCSLLLHVVSHLPPPQKKKVNANFFSLINYSVGVVSRSYRNVHFVFLCIYQDPYTKIFHFYNDQGINNRVHLLLLSFENLL